ncbi:MAG: thiamine phosphate synthase [Pseudomonadota bacterium]
MAKKPPKDAAPEKAQLVLTVDAQTMGAVDAGARIAAAMSGGGVVAVILPRFDMDGPTYDSAVTTLVPFIQEAGAAALLDGVEASQTMGRIDADGLLVEAKGESWVDDVLDLLDRANGQRSIGLYGQFSRDSALTAGDVAPDMIHLGPLARDIKPEPHAKNLVLAEWWAQMIEVPCLIAAGNSLESVSDAVATRAEFVVLSQAVFGAEDPAAAVAKALNMIEAEGPELEFAD